MENKMIIFSERLKDLEKENNSQKALLNFLNIRDNTIFYAWINNKKGITLENAYLIAKFYKCSMDYLFGRTEETKEIKHNKAPNFSKFLKIILDRQKVTQYRLCKDCNISSSSIYNWTHDIVNPNMSSIIKIADYLQVSIDYLVGIE